MSRAYSRTPVPRGEPGPDAGSSKGPHGRRESRALVHEILASVKAGHLVPADDLPALPRSFADASPPAGQLWTFIAGDRNVCFTPESQRRSHAWFRQRSPQDHGLQLLPGYSHLDVFFGRRASEETFPHILAGLEKEPVPSG